MYEDMVRVPFIARYPGVIPAGSRTEAIQSLVDIALTILDFCGVELPGRMTGISQKDVWSGLLNEVRVHAFYTSASVFNEAQGNDKDIVSALLSADVCITAD